jgi:membrane protease YdiL (CAAX protease family)
VNGAGEIVLGLSLCRFEVAQPAAHLVTGLNQRLALGLPADLGGSEFVHLNLQGTDPVETVGQRRFLKIETILKFPALLFPGAAQLVALAERLCQLASHLHEGRLKLGAGVPVVRYFVQLPRVFSCQPFVGPLEPGHRLPGLFQFTPGSHQLGMLVGQPGAEVLFQSLEAGQGTLRLLQKVAEGRAGVELVCHCAAITAAETIAGTEFQTAKEPPASWSGASRYARVAQVMPAEAAPTSVRIDVRFVDLLIALGGAVLGIVAAIIALAILVRLDRGVYENNAVAVLLVGTILIYAGLFLGMLRFIRRLPDARRWLGLRRPTLSDFGLVGGLLVIWFVGTALIASAITVGMNRGKALPSNAREMFGNHGGAVGLLVLALLAAAVVAPICEELFFRGMLYRYLLRRWPVWLAVVVAATIFAILHFIPILIPVFLFLGLILTIQYEVTGSLTNSMMLHAAGNAVTTVLVYLSLNG